MEIEFVDGNPNWPQVAEWPPAPERIEARNCGCYGYVKHAPGYEWIDLHHFDPDCDCLLSSIGRARRR